MLWLMYGMQFIHSQNQVICRSFCFHFPWSVLFFVCMKLIYILIITCTCFSWTIQNVKLAVKQNAIWMSAVEYMCIVLLYLFIIKTVNIMTLKCIFVLQWIHIKLECYSIMVNFMYIDKLKQKIGVVWNVRGCYIRDFMNVKEHMAASRDIVWNSVISLVSTWDLLE